MDPGGSRGKAARPNLSTTIQAEAESLLNTDALNATLNSPGAVKKPTEAAVIEANAKAVYLVHIEHHADITLFSEPR